MDRQCFVVDPDPTYPLNADPDQDPESGSYTKFYTCLKIRILFRFYSQQCQSTLFYLSRQRHSRCQYSGQYIEIFLKKDSLAVHLEEMDTVRIRQNYADPTGSGSTTLVKMLSRVLAEV